jgi:hypothetical protein
MDGSTDLETAARFLDGLELGSASAAELRRLGERLDPVLVHVIVRFLREVYDASQPAASAVLERVAKLTAAYPGLVARSREGEADPVTQWFVSAHTFREFRGRGRSMIETIVDKLES